MSSEMKQLLKEAIEQEITGASSPLIPPEFIDKFSELMQVSGDNVRLVAFTVTAALSAYPEIDPAALKVQSGGIDLRSKYKSDVRSELVTLAQSVGVKWSPSEDPFVSNPFRESRIDQSWLDKRLGKLRGANELLMLVEFLSNKKEMALNVLRALVHLERRRLEAESVEVLFPRRVSASRLLPKLNNWVSEGTGGKRMEAIAATLLRFIGKDVVGIWESVESHHVNDPAPIDLKCFSKGSVVCVAEVKDQEVTMNHIIQLCEQAREHQSEQAVMISSKDNLKALDASKEYEDYSLERLSVGIRIYCICIYEALRSWLMIADYSEDNLPMFLREIVNELEENGERDDLLAFSESLKNL